MSFVRKGSYANLHQWLTFVGRTYPEIQTEVKAADSARKAKAQAASRAGASYNLVLQDTDKGAVCWFLPEPSRRLPSHWSRQSRSAKRLLRPPNIRRQVAPESGRSKEKEEFQDAIIEDLALMGVGPDVVTYTSDYFDHLYETCLTLIKGGHAYADNTDAETTRDERGRGVESKRRNRTVEENANVFEQMKSGTEEGLKNCIRAKISVDNPNKARRDLTKWKTYPTYGLACPVVDSLEGVAHALRPTEYTDRNLQFQWFLNTRELRQVYMWDFSRMNFIRTFLSKRKLAKLVDNGKAWGWDDPRMPTIRGVGRRGITTPALRDFILKQGPSRNVVTMDWTSNWAANKNEIDPVAPRHTAISKKDSVKDGEAITLMQWGNAFVRDVAGADPITMLIAELNMQGHVRATDKKVTWLSTQGQKLVDAELRDSDCLIMKDKLEKDDGLEKFLNPMTATMEEAFCDEGVVNLNKDDTIQFEQRGYYRIGKTYGDGDERKIILFCIPTGKNK
ncbi:hypothetical protein EKO27_g6569 [Xylaria grammica]|uniref:Glutamyl/glutaminyl-tRNA synthetase class Ib catalytic domain-containing protein n=1 Tax=Xylaria grammica TaxID=363999 RepID=A0A439D239_9PEZI|nr:hypothetical protein EKO27_g6569 [Xylaria grammica]